VLAPAAWLICLALAPEPVVSFEDAHVDPVATTDGLRLRLGDALDGWTIRVRGTDVRAEVEVHLRAPDGTEQTRSVVLGATTSRERSRELAATVALIIEQHEPVARASTERKDTGEKETRARRVSGWLGVGPRVGLGPPSALDPDVGVTLDGGLWLVRDHLQPVLQAGWSRSMAGDLHVDGVRIGAGVLFGGSLLDRRLWLGAGAIGRALWARAEDRSTDERWVSSTELVGAVQLRIRPGFLLGFRTGADLTLPPLSIAGQRDALRYGPVRWIAGLSLGFWL
jgi:hypothetical protein